jgi:REP element-mobilizing transposase RayT
MLINHVNADHVHALVDLPKDCTIENLFKLLKGSSSHWVNENQLLAGRFSWGRGYAALSVSQSNVSRVAQYIRNQDAHHRKKSFREEIEGFVRLYGLEFVDDEEGEEGGNR